MSINYIFNSIDILLYISTFKCVPPSPNIMVLKALVEGASSNI